MTMKWFKVTVENEVGIIAEHYVLAHFPSSAREHEEERGLLVLNVEPWSPRAK
jgi:hypothetical protein